MTDIEIERPRATRVDFAIRDEPYFPHAGWTRFLSLVAGGAYPHLLRRAWSTSAHDLTALASHAVVTGSSDRVQSALVDLACAWAYVSLDRGRAVCSVAAASVEDGEAARAWLEERLPVAQAEDSRVPVEFWARTSSGGYRTSHALDVPSWTDVACNYPKASRAAIERLLASPPRDRGRLILWHGPPGTGKTHVVRALAWEWREWCDLQYVTDPEELFGSSEYMLDVLLDERDDDRWRLLVLEDTGELLSADAKERTGQGLSRFLNVADGIIGQGLRVLVLVTTNESLRSLHPAVCRPGRCAFALEFGPFPPGEAAAWLAAHGAAPVEETLTLADLYARAEGRVLLPAREPRRVGF